MFGTPKGVNHLWTWLLIMWMLERKVRDWLKNDVSNHKAPIDSPSHNTG